MMTSSLGPLDSYVASLPSAAACAAAAAAYFSHPHPYLHHKPEVLPFMFPGAGRKFKKKCSSCPTKHAPLRGQIM